MRGTSTKKFESSTSFTVALLHRQSKVLLSATRRAPLNVVGKHMRQERGGQWPAKAPKEEKEERNPLDGRPRPLRLRDRQHPITVPRSSATNQACLVQAVLEQREGDVAHRDEDEGARDPDLPA